MPYLDVYVSMWADTVQAAEEGRAIGTPVRRSPFFYPGHVAFGAFREQMRAGALVAEQTDWAAWVARVTKAEILRFRDSLGVPDVDGEGFEHLRREYDALKAYLEGLDPEGDYALVACEL
jgi:hypothetical protein